MNTKSNKATGFKIGNRSIGGDHPVFIVAELSGNHRQDFDIAVKSIESIKECGLDAVKLQTYTPDTMTIDSDSDPFQIRQGTIWDGRSLYDLYKEAHTPWEWQPKLKKIAEDLGLVCFSTPFDKTSVDFLERIGMEAYKVASFEITDIPLIEYIASKGKPVIMSTGIATHSDIKEAVNACRRMKNDQIALLKCTSSYPASPEEMNLKTIPDMAVEFNVISGLSDHTLSMAVPVASVALEAKIIEKHFILDKKLRGPDATFSLCPDEFKKMVESVREAEKALGRVSYELTGKVKKNRAFSRSLFVVKDVKAKEAFTKENVRSIRPADGLSPKHISEILSKKAKKDIKKGSPLSWDMVA